MGGFRLAQVGFKSPWVGVGPLVLVGGRGFAYLGLLRVVGLVVVVENGSDLVLFFIFYFLLSFGFVDIDLAVVDVDGGSGGGSGGGWFGFWIWNLDFVWVF